MHPNLTVRNLCQDIKNPSEGTGIQIGIPGQVLKFLIWNPKILSRQDPNQTIKNPNQTIKNPNLNTSNPSDSIGINSRDTGIPYLEFHNFV